MKNLTLLPLFLMALISLKAQDEALDMPYEDKEDRVVIVPLTDRGDIYQESLPEAWINVLNNRMQQLTSNVASYSRIVRALTLASQSDAFKGAMKKVINNLADSVKVLFSQINEVIGEEDRERLSYLFNILERVLVKVKKDPSILKGKLQDPQLKKDLQDLKVLFFTAIAPALQQEQTEQPRAQSPQAQKDVLRFFLKVAEDGNEVFSSED
jgi:hypothetical protein